MIIQNPKLGQLEVEAKLAPCLGGTLRKRHRTAAQPGLWPDKRGRPMLAWYCHDHGLLEAREIDRKRLTACEVDTLLIDAAIRNIVIWESEEYIRTGEENDLP